VRVSRKHELEELLLLVRLYVGFSRGRSDGAKLARAWTWSIVTNAAKSLRKPVATPQRSRPVFLF